VPGHPLARPQEDRTAIDRDPFRSVQGLAVNLAGRAG
jgi:hypothetical protein